MDLGKDKVICKILSRLACASADDGPIKVDGTWGSFAPMLAAHISKQLKRPILYVSSHLDDADNVADDLAIFTGRSIELFPVWEGATEYADATDEIGSHRLRIAMGLARAAKTGSDLSDLMISTCAQAINQPVPAPKLIEQGGLTLQVSQTIEPDLVNCWLIDNGFERVDSVDVPGQFAQRGGIIDIFASVTTASAQSLGTGTPREPEPIRIEFFGDQIESIRRIDLDSQRSSGDVEKASIVAPRGHEKLSQTENLINLLPDNTIILLEEPTDIAEVSRTFLDRVDDPTGLYSWQALYKAMSRFVQFEICRFGGGSKANSHTLDVTSAQQFEHKSGQMWKGNKAVLEELLDAAKEKNVLLYCENEAEISRVKEIVIESHGKIPKNIKFPLGFIQQGFVANSLNTIVVTHHEMFGQYAVRRRIRSVRSASPVESLVDLSKGDYVVHLTYGIGKFIGIRTMEKGRTTTEYLTIEYADEMLIHVPVSNISFVQKYIGALATRPKLSRIGSKKWENQKDKVARGVKELAVELLEMQAEREGMGGFAFGEDTAWQKEFEQSFLYQETADQLTAVAQIKDDMKAPRPMDRLLCGDVGYGKTELAMRAAFKAVAGGKQVAVLVPTTVLCVQHGRTFAERFADFPITIEVLNRFVTGKKAAEVVARAKLGRVDIVIGTHRLLSKDVGFKDLGLLVIDEEQRFGVEHKERLKKYRVNVDILTMTATPIPRTLHMSLLGLRDISSLATPPLDRRSIATKVCRWDKSMIRKSIMHELNRDGQIFFVHNRVQTIKRMAEEIRKIVKDPKVSIDIGHGQMPKRDLEKAMLNFVKGRTDILVCSTIIESGLDIPNANTMIINEADRFGLAQLHQLRGRVGRYKHRAYAYMLLPASRPVTPIAVKRLKAIEEYSQLGAGFRIALRDLEIRGAGNILGPEQSGHINMVGYEMYCRLLSEAVKTLKNEPIDRPPSVLIDLGFSTYIPKSYIPSDRQRMDVYRRIALTMDERDVKRIAEELADMFGPVPQQVQMLLDIAELRIKAARWKIKSIITSNLDLAFTFADPAGTADLFARAPGKVRVLDKKTVNIRLEKNYFEPTTIMVVLRKLLNRKNK